MSLVSLSIKFGDLQHFSRAWAAVMCVLFCLGCIPYLMSSLMDVKHKCGHCGALLATWHRSGRTVVHAHG